MHTYVKYYAAVEIQPYPGETGGLPRRKLIPLSLLGNHDHLLYHYVANKSVYPYPQRETVCPLKVTIKRKARNLLTLVSARYHSALRRFHCARK